MRNIRIVSNVTHIHVTKMFSEHISSRIKIARNPVMAQSVSTNGPPVENQNHITYVNTIYISGYKITFTHRVTFHIHKTQ